jgi:isoleucyl-tRNA synthetase
MYQNLAISSNSVHLTNLVKANKKYQDKSLEEKMELAQKISSMILSIRKKENLKVRQPLQRIRIPVLSDDIKGKIEAVKDLILSEVNVKELEFVTEGQVQIVKNLKLNFKTLGKKCGQYMKAVQAFAQENANEIITGIERNSAYTVQLEGAGIVLEPEDVEIIPVDIPGWKVANSGSLTVALDITISEVLKHEGMAREIVNRIQNYRKDNGFEVTDKIFVKIQQNELLDKAIQTNLSYICNETLTQDLQLVSNLEPSTASTLEVDELVKTLMTIEKLN